LSFLAGSIVGKIILDASQWTMGQAQVQKETELLKKGMTGLKIAALAVSAGITAAFIGMAKSADEFEKRFANVTTVLDTSVVNVKAMKAELLGLDARLGSAADLTEGLYQALSASVEPTKAIQFVADAALFAKAALTSTNTAVDVITTSLNAYGMSADQAARVSDVLFETIKLGKVTGEQLAGAIGNSIPLAASMGVTFEELNAHMVIYTRQGINIAEATTRFNGILNEILKPSKELGEAIKKIGFESGSTAVKTLGVHETLLRLIATTDGSQESLAKMFNNVRALQGVLSSTGQGATDFNNILETLTNSTGSTNEAFEKQEVTFATLHNSINKAFIILGESFLPIVKDVVKVITNAATWVANWDEGTKRLVLGVAAFVAAAIPLGMLITSIIKSYQILQPILLAIKAGFAFQAAAAGSSTIAITANTIATNIQTGALKLAAASQGVLNVVMMAAPYILVAAGIALLVTGLVSAYQKTQSLTETTKMLSSKNDLLKKSVEELQTANKDLNDKTKNLNDTEKGTLETRQKLASLQLLANLKETIDATVKQDKAQLNQSKTIEDLMSKINAEKEAREASRKILANYLDLFNQGKTYYNETTRSMETYAGAIDKVKQIIDIQTKSINNNEEKLAKANLTMAESNVVEKQAIELMAAGVIGNALQLSQIGEINQATMERVRIRVEQLKNEKLLVELSEKLATGQITEKDLNNLNNKELIKKIILAAEEIKLKNKNTTATTESTAASNVLTDAYIAEKTAIYNNVTALATMERESLSVYGRMGASITTGIAEQTEKDRLAKIEIQKANEKMEQDTLSIYHRMGAAITAGQKEQADKEKANLEEKIALYKQTYDKIVGYASQGFSSINALVDQLQTNESTALENDYVKRKETIENSVADEETKSKQLEALDKEFADKRAALKKKEFISNQIASAVNATIATANAVVNVLATPLLPPWVSIPLSIVMGGLGAAQVAAILAQPIPEFGMGGDFNPGLMIVGDKGPELMQIDQPGHIYSNQDSKQMFGNRYEDLSNNLQAVELVKLYALVQQAIKDRKILIPKGVIIN
jgi:TP901 family phage tail tape measure protein